MKFAGLLKLPRRAMPCLAVSAIILGLSGIAKADNNDCFFETRTLRGSYVFAATGYNIVSGVPQPKAIIVTVKSVEAQGADTVAEVAPAWRRPRPTTRAPRGA